MTVDRNFWFLCGPEVVLKAGNKAYLPDCKRSRRTLREMQLRCKLIPFVQLIQRNEWQQLPLHLLDQFRKGAWVTILPQVQPLNDIMELPSE